MGFARAQPILRTSAVIASHRNDDWIQLHDLAACFARGLACSFRPLQSEGAGNAGRPMRPIAACANVVVERTRVSQVTPELRALPGDRALLPPSLAECSANLTPASGCQDHTPSPSASVPFVNGTSTSTASHPASVTIAIRPSSGTRQWAYTTDLGRTASIISEIPKLGAVARMEPTGRREAPPDGAIRDSTRAAKIPEFASLRPGYDARRHFGDLPVGQNNRRLR